jgi:hypothetical protein
MSILENAKVRAAEKVHLKLERARVKAGQELIERLTMKSSGESTAARAQRILDSLELSIRKFEGFRKRNADLAAEITRLMTEKSQHDQTTLEKTWDIILFILPHETLVEVYEPLFNEFREDYLSAYPQQSKWGKRWLKFCFGCKTVFMVIGCFRVLLVSKTANLFWALMPEPVRKFLKGLSS